MKKTGVVTRLHPLLLLAESSYRRCKRDVAPAADPMSAPAKSIGEVQWSQPATKGDKPAPRSGHTITVRELRSVAPSPAPSNRLRSCSVCLTPSHCSRAILALQVVGDKPLTSWSVVSLGTQHTQAPTPPQTSAHVVRPLEIAPATRAKFVLLRERPVFAAATLAAAVRL